MALFRKEESTQVATTSGASVPAPAVGPSSPLTAKADKRWHNRDMLDGLAGWAVQHRPDLAPDQSTEWTLMMMAIRAVKMLEEAGGFLKQVGYEAGATADLLLRNERFRRAVVEFSWRISFKRMVLFPISGDDPMVPVLQALLTKERLAAAAQAEGYDTEKVSQISSMSVHFTRQAPQKKVQGPAETPAISSQQ